MIADRWMVENGESNVFGPGVLGFCSWLTWPDDEFSYSKERLRSFKYCTSRSHLLMRYNPNLQFFHTESLVSMIWLDNGRLVPGPFRDAPNV